MTPQREKPPAKRTSRSKKTAKKTVKSKKATSTRKKAKNPAKKTSSTPRSTRSRATKRTLVSQTEFARMFGMTTRTVRRWIEQGLPREGEGRTAQYPLEACIAWVRDKDREEAVEASRPRSLEEARIRKAIADAELVEYELGLKRKELMTVQQYKDAISGAFGRVNAQLMTLENRMAPAILNLRTLDEARAKIHEHVMLLRAELRDASLEDEAE